MKRYETETVATNTLREGDLIIAHGGLFRVFNVARYAVAAGENVDHGPTQANYCEYLGDVHPDYPCSIPEHWRDGRKADERRHPFDHYWNQQGNGLARTLRVIGIRHR